jgi:hypothetical protein
MEVADDDGNTRESGCTGAAGIVTHPAAAPDAVSG